MNNQVFKDDLQEIIHDYLETHPKVRLSGLSRISGVSESTLRRMANGQSVSTPKNVMQVLKTIYKDLSVAEIIALLKDKEIGKFIKEESFFMFSYHTSMKEKRKALEEILSERDAFLIYSLAANKCGSTRREIKKLFGDLGEKRLNEMISNKYIQEERNGELHATQKSFSVSPEIMKKHIVNLMRFFKSHNCQINGKNIISTLSDSVNKDGFEKIIKIQQECCEKILKIYNDPKYSGKIPTFALSAIDTLSSD